MSNYTYTALTNVVYSNNLYCSNSTVFASNTAVSATTTAVYASNNFSTFSNAIYPFINSNTSRSTFGCNDGTFASNALPNYRLSSVAIDYSTLTNTPDFLTTTGLAIRAATISSLGALNFANSEMFSKDGYLTRILQSAIDAAHNAINLASGYQRLSSFLEVGTRTTRIQDNLLIMKSNASSNLILSPSNLSASNSIFSLNSLINTTATSIFNLTHVSCSSNLTVTGNLTVSGVSSNGILSVSKNSLYLDDGNKGLVYSGALSTYNSNFTSTDGPVLYGWNGGSLASAAPGYGGNFAIRQSNLTRLVYWTPTGLGVFKSNPAYSLDVSGSANILNNLFVGGTFSNVGNLACTGLTMNNPSTVSGVSTLMCNPFLNSNSYQLHNFGVNTSVNYNAAYHGFFNYSNSSPSNYASLGIWGNSIGTQTFNVMANGNFGIKTTTPRATLEVNGTFKTTGNAPIVGALSATTLSGSLPFTSLATVPSLLFNASSLGWSNIVGTPAYV
jgi:hypothetical protein